MYIHSDNFIYIHVTLLLVAGEVPHHTEIPVQITKQLTLLPLIDETAADFAVRFVCHGQVRLIENEF